MPEGNEEELTVPADLGRTGTHASRVVHPLFVAPAVGAEFNTFGLDIIPVACMALADILFEFDSSFIMPKAAKILKDLPGLRDKHKNAGGELPPLSIFGHADPVGDDEYNKQLSGRRATAVYGLLTRDVALWSALNSTPYGGDDWKSRKVEATMRSTLGDAAPGGRPELFEAYMEAICPFKLGKEDFLGRGDPDGKADYQGCSEFNPLIVLSRGDASTLPNAERNSINQPNRRVVIYIFRAGARVDPKLWPCPTAKEKSAGCRARFFVSPPKGDDRRKPGQARREHETTADTLDDTFACRFYDRIADLSPCEGPIKPVVPTVLIRAENGVDPAATCVAVSTKTITTRIKLKGVPAPNSAGVYTWSTGSSKITLENADQQTVTVVSGLKPSDAPEAEEIKLEFTAAGGKQVAPVTHKIGVATVVFSKEDSHPWGYDAWEKIPYQDYNDVKTEPTPGPEMDFISIKRSKIGKVKVTIQGARPSDIFFKSVKESICKPKVVQPDANPFVLEVDAMAVNKVKTEVGARIGSLKGTEVARIGVVVLKELTYKAELFRVHDPKSAGTALGNAFKGSDLNAELNKYYKPGVAVWDVIGGTSDKDIAYDRNKNGILDLEPGKTSEEEKKVTAKCLSSRQRIIYVHDLRWTYYLKSNAGSTDTKFTLKNYGKTYLGYIGQQTYTIDDEKGNKVVVKIKKVDTTTGVVEIDAALGQDFKTADRAALIFPLGGLSGDPLFVSDVGSLADIINYAAHELGHAVPDLFDLCEKDNVMFGGGETGSKMRHRPIARYYDPTKNEEQWLVMKGR